MVHHGIVMIIVVIGRKVQRSYVVVSPRSGWTLQRNHQNGCLGLLRCSGEDFRTVELYYAGDDFPAAPIDQGVFSQSNAHVCRNPGSRWKGSDGLVLSTR